MHNPNFMKDRITWLLLLAPVFLRLPQLLGWLSADPMYFVGYVGDSGHLPLGTPWIDPNVGFHSQALGKLSADLWLKGQIPWWNPFNGVGLPLAGEAQIGSLFLPFVLIYHFRQGFLWLEIIFQVIAGLCTYALLRKLNISRLASLAAALLFELNGSFAWHAAPIISPIAFLPMLLLGVETLLDRTAHGKQGGWWLIPLALSWSIYSGFPEPAYIDGLLVSVWVLCRLPDLPARRRLPFMGTLALAVFAGLLLSIPQIIPFAEYLTLTFIGGHADAFAHASLPPAAAALSLAPWLYGPIFTFYDPAGAIPSTWANIGGYFTVLELVLVLLAIQLAPRRLLFGMLIWMVLCLGKTFGIHPLSDIANLIPLVKSSAFRRYAFPSWEFAGIVIIAFGIHAIQEGKRIERRHIVTTFAIALGAIIFALWLAREPLSYLWVVEKAQPYLYAALTWTVCSLLIFALCLMIKQPGRLARIAAIILLLDSSVAFTLPVLSGARDTRQHEPGIAFLKTNIGLQRVYSLGQMAPNYGAYFQVAQINHNYLPVPIDWVRYVYRNLDPAINPETFNGHTPRATGYGSAIDQLKARLPAYEEAGVKYVLAPPTLDVFSDALTVGTFTRQRSTLKLTNGQGAVVRWDIPAARYARTLRGIFIPVGNYAGKADGQLIVQICMAKDVCATAAGNLKDSVDNVPFNLSLDHDLLIPASDSATFVPLVIQFVHSQATQPVAIWMADVDAFQTGNVSLEGVHTNKAPAFSLLFTSTEKLAEPSRVYTGPDMAIYELPDSKPYFEALEGQCSLHPQSRTHIQLQCSTPAKLLRREAFYPGWTASVDGTSISLERAHELFQVITIPAGSHAVEYSYRPMYWKFLAASFSMGMLLFLYGIWKEKIGKSQSKQLSTGVA